MKIRRYLVALPAVLILSLPATAQEPKEAPGDRAPILRLEAGGPTSYVTGLAFSPDGSRLYAAGWDKVVRVWKLDEQGKFVLDPNVAFRVPLGPGGLGRLNALALSADGAWLAVAGQGTFRGAAGFGTKGFVLPTMGTFSREMREDWGAIYVFNVHQPAVRLLRGHTGTVLSLAFAPGPADRPLLVSAARDWNETERRGEGAIRLWDVNAEKSLAVLPGLPESPFARPGLAVWRTGPAADQLQVALAWADTKLRFWDVAGKSKAEEEVSKYTNAVLADLSSKRLLTAESGPQETRLRPWRLVAGQTPKAPILDTVKVLDTFPQALALIANPRGDGRSFAASVVRRDLRADGKQAYLLQLLALDGDRFGTVETTRPLWQGDAKQPVMAVAPTGRHLAVAGNDPHEVLIFDVADLLGKKGTPQTLSSVGTTFRSASLVTRAKDFGLVLSESEKKAVGQLPKEPAAGDLVFDFAKDALTDDLTGWMTNAADVTGWHAELKDNLKDTLQGPELHVFKDKKAFGRKIVLMHRAGPRPVVTDYALLPPHGAVKVPVLAVAVHLSGQPMLYLYDAVSGAKVRQFTGHTDRIYSLAFSADGRLLVSAGEDQTVCVWSLTNLPRLLGQVGHLPGVVVISQRGKLIVGRVDADSPLQKQVRKDEVVEGIVENGKLRPFATVREFYEAMLRSTPGKEVTLRFSSAPGQRDENLLVGHGADERKPLLSLFVSRAGRVADRHWIGWSPLGPYEASTPRAEQYLGWHFNTGKRPAPTGFALADQYRKQYYRPGLLRDLVAKGDTAMLPPAPALPAPRLAALVEADGGAVMRDPRDQYLVRHPRPTLKLDVLGRSLDSLDAVTWRLDDGAEQRFDLNQPDQRLALQLQPIARGLHRLRVAAQVPELATAGDWQELLLRYQPPAPRVEATGQDRQPVVREAAFTLRAQVHPGLAGEEVTVRIVHKNKIKTLSEEERLHTIDPAKPLALEKLLQLQPGWNQIEVVAVNRQALKGFEETETGRLTLEVTLIQKAAPPRIALEAIVPDGAPLEKRLEIVPGQPVRVTVAKVQVIGRMEATEELIRAEWERDGTGKPAALTAFKPGQQKLPFRETITLRPGSQALRFRAKTDTSDAGERVVSLLFQPPVPTAVLMAPRPDFVMNGDGETIAVQLQARLVLPVERHAFKTVVVHNGEELAVAPVIDEAAGTLTVQVPLRPGANRLQFRLRNEWDSVFTSEEVRGYFLRPPRLLALDAPPLTERSLVAITARVRSVLPLQRERVKVQVNAGQRRTVEATVERDPQKPDQWIVRLPEVPLDAEPGPQRVEVWVSNAEAECPQPLTATITYRPKQPPPAVEIVEPVENEVMHQVQLTVRGRIQSRSPLQQVRLVPGGGKPISLPAAKWTPLGKDSWEVVAQVVLKPGTVVLRLEAANAGGAAEESRTVSYVPGPVRVELVRLGGREPLVLKNPVDGRRAFPTAEVARAQLEGRVLWDTPDDERLALARSVRVYVNGLQQSPAELLAPVPGSSERRFKTNLLLSHENNRVEVFLPGLAQEAGNRAQSQADVACKRPMNQLRMHLLIVSHHAGPGGQLQEQFRHALRASPGPLGLRSPAFDPVISYGPLTGDLTDPAFIYRQLAVMRERIEGLAHAGEAGNDVVVFYFQGAEAIDAQGNLFGGQSVGAPRSGERTGLSCDFLVSYFTDMPGAHILLFDVDRQEKTAADGRDKIARWQEYYPESSRHAAVLRYSWLGKPNPQRNDRLIKALETVLPEATHLIDVTTNVHRLATESPQFKKKSLQYDDYLSTDLQDLFVSRRP